MSDDVFATMGLSGFGKATKKKQLDPNRFDKNKRSEVCSLRLHFPPCAYSNIGQNAKDALVPEKAVVGPSWQPVAADPLVQSREDASEDDVGPLPPPALENGEAVSAQEEPEYDPSDFEDDNDSAPEFPVTHETILKDHTKVVSALALDPSGARIVSGSHDYDCKLWDFGGMDMRCKPFKSWEPAGTYHVRHLLSLTSFLTQLWFSRYMT